MEAAFAAIVNLPRLDSEPNGIAAKVILGEKRMPVHFLLSTVQ